MKLFPKTRPVAVLLALLLAGLLLWQSPALAQETTGSVSGVVKDVTGALVPQATVVLTDLQNRSVRKTVSNNSGNFTIPSVSSSLRYQVTVTMAGFKKWQSQPFALRPGDRIQFSDIKLQIGEASAQVTVEGTESQAVKPLDTPERSDVITAKDLETLAIEGRDATELIETLPGFAMASPGVNNQASANTAVVGMSGPTGGFSADGAGPTGLAVVLDGVSLTDIQTNSGTVQTVDADMVQEIKASTSTFSAANAKGPAVLNATTKAGTTSFHGEGYLYVRDTGLNANDWYNNYLQQTRPAGRYFYPGGQVGGPLWIPGTRFTRVSNKLFFFAGFEVYNQYYSPETLGSWVPTMAERSGDFSVANLNAQLCGSRPDGGVNPNAIEPMCYAENYLANGTGVNNGNVTNYADPNGVALVNWLPLPDADPFRNFSGYNYVQEVLQHQNGDILHTRVDFAIDDNNKLTATYGRQSEITDMPVGYNAVQSNAMEYPGKVTSGDISNIASLTYTRVFGATVTNEFGAALSFISNPGNMGDPEAVDRFDMNGYNCNDPAARAAGSCGSSGHGNFNYLGEYKNAGDYSVPALSDYSDLGYPNMQMPGGFYNNQVHMKKVVPDLQDSVSWVKGPHFFQFGIYYEKGILNGIADPGAFPQGEYTFNPGNSYYEYNTQVGTAAQYVGCENPNSAGTSRTSGASYLGECINPIAMMYLGTPDSYQQTNFTPTVNMQYTTLAGYVNDQWKLHRVTLMLGTRIEHLGPWVDRRNNGLATFSANLYNQDCAGRTCGSVNMPGITWHAQDSSVANSVNKPAAVYFSPRVGLAWDILGHGNTVLRGGWGIYRHEEEFAPYALAAATAQGYKTTYIQQQWTFANVDEQAPINPPDFTAYTLNPNDTERPTYYEYNVTVSQRLKWRSLLEVSYVGNNNRNMSSFNQGSAYNEASDLNVIPGGYMFQGAPAFCLCNIPISLVTSGSGNSIGDLTTPEQDSLRPYPFYEHIYSLKHNFYANYNSLQVSWNKSSGIFSFGANYVFSKDLATAASWNNNIPDPINLRNDYNPAAGDRSQVVNIHYLVDLGTRYHGDSHLLSAAANGWQISGFSTIQSGPDLPSEEGGNFGFGYGQITPTQLSVGQQMIPTEAQTCQTTYMIPVDKNGNQFCTNNLNPTVWLGSPDYELMPTVHCNPSGGSKKHQYINPTCFGVPEAGGPSTGIYALSSNPSGQGQYRLPYIHGPYYQNHNISVLKNFGMGEGRNLQFRAEAFNPFNHALVSFNNNDTTNLNLGNLYNAVPGQALTLNELRQQNFGIANVKYGSRLLELGAKYIF